MIPAFNLSGVLPPYTGANPADRTYVSPYKVNMSDVVNRFATSLRRVEILRGLLDYREQLLRLNIVDGYQWLDGSFVENVEVIHGRDPNDIDVVTFARRPMSDLQAWKATIQSNPNLFNPRNTKSTFMCDAYFVDLLNDPKTIISDTAYLFGLFSHQRKTSLWKGMLHVPLVSDDATARALI